MIDLLTTLAAASMCLSEPNQVPPTHNSDSETIGISAVQTQQNAPKASYTNTWDYTVDIDVRDIKMHLEKNIQKYRLGRRQRQLSFGGRRCWKYSDRHGFLPFHER